jgi:hypothetical protein
MGKPFGFPVFFGALRQRIATHAHARILSNDKVN